MPRRSRLARIAASKSGAAERRHRRRRLNHPSDLVSSRWFFPLPSCRRPARRKTRIVRRRVDGEMRPRRELAFVLPARVDGVRIADAVIRAGERAILLDDDAQRAGVAAVAQRMHDDAELLALRVALA